MVNPYYMADNTASLGLMDQRMTGACKNALNDLMLPIIPSTDRFAHIDLSSIKPTTSIQLADSELTAPAPVGPAPVGKASSQEQLYR